MKTAKDFLQQFIQENPYLAEQLENYKVDIFSLWPNTLNQLGLATLAQNSQLCDLERHHLRLIVYHSVFLQELKLQQNLWLPAFEMALRQAEYPSPRISKVSFRMQYHK